MDLRHVPLAATAGDAATLDLGALLFGFNLRDSEDRRQDPRLRKLLVSRTAPVLGLPLVFREEVLDLIGAVANGELL